MRKTGPTILGMLLLAGSTVQASAAAERYARKAHRAPVATWQQFRNANNAWPNPYATRQSLSDYSEGHVISAPAGH